MGDFNAYAKEDPIQYFINEGGLANLESETAYSYSYGGQIGTLDYVLVSKNVMAFNPNAHIWHVNSLEPYVFDYNLEYSRNSSFFNVDSPIRFSDHDPALLGLEMHKSDEENDGRDDLESGSKKRT
eukprot:CAMPEP_0113323128 /NCGR_PEP_ID=MMETSP0010_2-20120614/16076_1 /TAXON_ID=216773 ORGANISM="Corethron hystrix, Strain 308" /NCGR_SAMPLE_ID=MMETSP0010_2 /ASSEMBLY_ACC=CAM_ASM_000155 /LENGTH=125 /DNA_ID=CAMNT_0000181879 /DNA_START=63 /DNA_END=436 /DNA_ORIENTATION=+ /assembly_acc=CAM_ASM_000155